jgi:hypothetical protein
VPTEATEPNNAPRKRRRVLRWIALGLVLVLLLPPLALLIIAWLEISISAGLWRATIARAATEALGREVTLEGPLEFVPSFSPRLKVGGIRITNPPGFSTPELASLGDARLWVDAWALLDRRVRVREITAENVRVYLEVAKDRSVNWALGRPGAAPEPTPVADTQAALETAKAFDFEVETLVLHNLAVEYHSRYAGGSHFFDLDELTGSARRGQPMQLTLRGRVEKQFPYSATIEGGSARDLLRSTQAWPFSLRLEFLGSLLNLEGRITRGAQAAGVWLRFGVGTEDLRELERLLQTKFPNVGATGLSGEVQADARSVKLTNLRGVMGRTTLQGELALDLSAATPRVTGRLALPTLDLRPFLTGEKEAKESANLLETYRELEQVDVSLRELKSMNADLTFEVGQWLSLPGDVRDVSLRLQLDNGVLRAPIQATIAAVALRGEAKIDGASEVPSFDLALGAKRTQLGGLAALLAGLPGVQGKVDAFEFRVAGRGENLGALTRTVDVKLAIDGGRLTYGNVEGGRPVDLRLDRLSIALPGGKPLEGRMEGALLGEAFQARLSAGDLPSVARTMRSPIALSARATGAELQVKGVLAEPRKGGGTEIEFRLEAPRAGDVARWLGLAPDARVAARVQGRVRVESDAWRLSDFSFRLGRSQLAAQLARVEVGGRPLLQVRVDVDTLDLPELDRLRPAPKAQPAPPPVPVPSPEQAGGSTLELPILPRGIDLSDADLEVNVKRVILTAAEVTGAAFRGRVREGHMYASPFSATIADTLFSGAVAIDLRGSVPEASLWLATSDVDVGRLLARFKIIEDIDARVASLRLQLVGRGSRLGEILEKSALDVDLEAGSLTLRDAARRPLVSIALAKGQILAPAGMPVAMSLDGTIDDIPVAIRIGTGAVRDLVRPGSKVPFSLNAEAAGARLDLQGKVSTPIQRQEGELTLEVKGERFDSLNRLARVELPPWGPWSFGGRFVSSERGYEVPDLRLRIGESRLEGRGAYNALGVRPRLDVALGAPHIQLDDFRFGAWSPFEKQDAAPERKRSVEEMRAKAKEAAAQGQKLLSRETLTRMDAYLDVKVDAVLSGADRLGSGSLHAQLANGRLEFGPARVEVPGGSALLSAAYEPGDADVAVQARIDVERFDYGILARRIKPDTDLQGLFSLQFAIDSRAPTLDALMAHADGRIDFAVWPKNMRAGIFDLWAVNVFIALVPAVDPAKESKVNCAVGRFDLRDGKLTPDAILLDTSRMRVGGEGRVDFDSEQLYLRLAPKAKEPQFFSLATPVQVSGTLTDYKIGVAPGGVAETVVRFFSSILVTPVEKLTKAPLPRDGADVCANALRVLEQKR